MITKKEHKPKILLVEDEATLAMIIKDTLEDEGFELIQAGDGIKGLNSFLVHRPDVIIADVMMPEMDGFEMVKRIRKSDMAIPILFLTARSSLNDLVKGFELGANDYLRKPFKMMELVMRVKALTNRAFTEKYDEKNKTFEIGNYTFNTTTQILIYQGASVELSYLESEILKRLCINQDKVVEIENILKELWHDNSSYNRNSLHVFIHKLRKLLSDDKRIRILNMRGVGYKLTVNI